MNTQEHEKFGSSLISKNITICGRRTSMRLEKEMWNALRDTANIEGCTIHNLCSLISLRKNKTTSLTSAIRVFLMLYYRASSTSEGHKRAGHGSFKEMQVRAKIKLDNHFREKWSLSAEGVDEMIHNSKKLSPRSQAGLR